MNKKGMELSINFIVMLILTLAVFSLGVVFVNNLFEKTEKIKLDMDANTEKQVENLLSQGQIVAVPLASKTVEAGSVAVFALGVVNTIEADEYPTQFKVDVSCFSCVKENDERCSCSDDVFAAKISDFELNKNAKKSMPIGIVTNKKAERASYGFLVKVLYFNSAGDEAVHGTSKPIYVTIS